MVKESDFQKSLKKKILNLFPGSIVLKTDTNSKSGIPDLIILYKNKWASLECKRHKPKEKDYRPLQQYYVEVMNDMSFSRVVYPENEEEVLHEMEQAFRNR